MPTSDDAASGSDHGPPAFDPVYEEPSAEERVYAAVLRAREPTGVQTISERASCDRSTARKYLDWFTELGIVTRYDDRTPVTYERNEAYFEWRRINELVEQYTVAALGERVSAIRDRIRAYQETYGDETPGAVDALAVADDDIEEVWADLTDWATKREELRRHERARQLAADRGLG